ncbi:MAG: hypothetical protein HY661_20950 [Betaproteobacteria bacterium]|nr:hypothetical protein [Betaproteobacteria bacterium]
MLLLRLGAILVAVAVAAGLALFFLTRDPRYLRFALSTFRWALIVALSIFALLALERLAEFL